MIIGYPCKSVSSQNGSAASFKDTKSKTGAGFKALKDYVRYARPRVVVAENVATMCHKRSKFGGEIPIDVQNKAFAAMGYAHYHELVSSRHFGLCQSRTRCWAVYILENEVGSHIEFLGIRQLRFKRGRF